MADVSTLGSARALAEQIERIRQWSCEGRYLLGGMWAESGQDMKLLLEVVTCQAADLAQAQAETARVWEAAAQIAEDMDPERGCAVAEAIRQKAVHAQMGT